MVRPRNSQPTPAELEVLQILWERGPSTVRDVLEVLNRRKRRAYTSVMSLLNVMADKRLLNRKAKGRAFVYAARQTKESTLGGMMRDFLGRAFDGSSAALVAQLLDQARPSPDEMEQIRRAIDAYDPANDDTPQEKR